MVEAPAACSLQPLARALLSDALPEESLASPSWSCVMNRQRRTRSRQAACRRLVSPLGLHVVRPDDQLPRRQDRSFGPQRTDPADDGDGPRRAMRVRCTLHRRPGAGPECAVIVCSFEPGVEQSIRASSDQPTNAVKRLRELNATSRGGLTTTAARVLSVTKPLAQAFQI